MTWKNTLQLEEENRDPIFQREFAGLFALHRFANTSILASDYSPRDDFADIISLTSSGEQWVPRIRAAFPNISLAEIKVALFLKFFHHDLLIDLEQTKSDEIKRELHLEIARGRMRYPWIYDRLLYDRFFDMFRTRTRELSYQETDRLLENTPQGVFQLRDSVVGPLGMLDSYCSRSLRPVREAMLWHCSDPSCYSLHSVEFLSGENNVTQATAFLESELRKIAGPPSEWDVWFFTRLDGSADYYDDMQLEQLPWLLANGFSETEMRSIVRRLIERYPEEMRSKLAAAKGFKDLSVGSAESVSARLGRPECFQVILLMRDEDIVECMESLIDDETIYVPPTETRHPVYFPDYASGGWFKSGCEASRFGVRSIPRAQNVALSRLETLIKRIYKEVPSEQLQWELRHVTGETINEKLDTCLRTEKPLRVIQDLIFTNRSHIERTFQFMRYGSFRMPSPEEEQRLAEKILWKLGFDIGLYPEYQGLFWERLEKLRNALVAHTKYDERDQESIRSAGANFFVSLEEVLDYSLSFIVWALLSDHYALTKFRCNFDEARRFTAARLNGARIGSGEPVRLDPEGRNTLYPLVQGFAALADLCIDLAGSGKGNALRPENQIPHYHGRTELQKFPFLHTILVLDIRKDDRDRTIDFLRSITASLNEAGICDIRNRLDHKRRDFPTKEEITTACDATARIVAGMESAGVCPLIYLYSGTQHDEYRRGRVVLRDYKGKEITIRVPSQYEACRLPRLGRPQIVVPSIHINDSSEILRFEFEEKSDFAQMWKDYPKRATRIQAESVAGITSEQTVSEAGEIARQP